MTFVEFKTQFAAFCEGTAASGKANSYASAMIYMAEYFGFTQMDRDAVDGILAHEEELQSENSTLYRSVLQTFTGQRRSSYLAKGFVRAAIPYLRDFRSRI